ncbi:hypothetical protein DM02DRAFT_653967 [Periconia macrospinosa]|uniref:Uncharacterized protein n=1 Tax=Periconia macrospinosa TaxID=97972 RepID=A0A2V1DUQ6_9PLEO|nr:hypothetical protein DM02DRAFT_653967 [Periconia macrospinosa]
MALLMYNYFQLPSTTSLTTSSYTSKEFTGEKIFIFSLTNLTEMPQQNNNHRFRSQGRGKSPLPNGNKFESFNRADIDLILSTLSSVKDPVLDEKTPHPFATSSHDDQLAPTASLPKARKGAPKPESSTHGPSRHYEKTSPPLPRQVHSSLDIISPLAFASAREQKIDRLVNSEDDESELNQATTESQDQQQTFARTSTTADDDFGMQSLSDMEDEPSVCAKTYAETLYAGNSVINEDEREVKEGFVFVEKDGESPEEKHGAGWKQSIFGGKRK